MNTLAPYALPPCYPKITNYIATIYLTYINSSVMIGTNNYGKYYIRLLQNTGR